MRILAIDTSALVASAALCEDETPIAVFSMKTGLTHSRTMLPMIRHLLDDSGVAVGDIELFAVTSGPGSFTGVRIGVSCIKGLAFGSEKPCVGVSTLEAMAASLTPLGTDALLCPVMDARRGQVYHALFDVQGAFPKRLMPDTLGDAKTLAETLERLCRPVFFVGDGAPLMDQLRLSCAMPLPTLLTWQNGCGVAKTALRVYREAEDKSVFTDLLLRPDYLRPSQAEREAAEKQAANS